MCRCTWPWNRYLLHSLDVRVWIWICMRHVCKCTCEIRVRKWRGQWENGDNKQAKGWCENLKSWSLFPRLKTAFGKKSQYCDSNSRMQGVVHMKEESCFSTRQSPQTQPGFSTNKWQDLNMNWKLKHATHNFSFAADKWMISKWKEIFL